MAAEAKVSNKAGIVFSLYKKNVLLNGQAIFIGQAMPKESIKIIKTALDDAYREGWNDKAFQVQQSLNALTAH